MDWGNILASSSKNAKRNAKRAANWSHYGAIKVSRGCEDPQCVLPDDFNFIPVDLDFDHEGQKNHNVSDMIRSDYSRDAIDAEIAECRVVCSMCHRRHTGGQRSIKRASNISNRFKES